MADLVVLSRFRTGKLSYAGMLAAILASLSTMMEAQVAAPMGTAQNFAVLAGSTVTNTGSSVLTGDLGVSPGTAITGFPPGLIQQGSTYSGDAVALQAESDTMTAYANLSGQACTVSYGTPTDIGGSVLAPGVYCFASSAQLTGMLTLDGGGDPNAVWIFKTGSTLTTASNSSVRLVNGAQQCKVFWQIGSSATLGTGTDFTGSILSLASITLATNVTLSGRALAINGAVTLDSNKVSFSGCRHACYEVTSKVIHTIKVAPVQIDASGKSVSGKVSGAALSPDGKYVWVTGFNNPLTPGFVSQVNVATFAVDSSTPVGSSPADIAFSAANRAWITNQYDSTLSQVDVPTLTPRYTVPVGATGSQYPSAVAFVNNKLLISTLGDSNAVPVFTTSFPPVPNKTLPVSGQSGRTSRVSPTAVYHAGELLMPVFVKTGTGKGYPSLAIVDPEKATILTTISLKSSGAVPEAVVVTPNGRYAYVSLFDSAGGTGGVWVVDLKSMATKTIINTGDPANYGEAISQDGQYILVAGYLKNQVALIYTASNSVDNIIQGGEQPNAIVLANGDSNAFVTNQTDGTVTVISFSPHI